MSPSSIRTHGLLMAQRLQRRAVVLKILACPGRLLSGPGQWGPLTWLSGTKVVLWLVTRSAHVRVMSEFGGEYRDGRESGGASSRVRREFRRVGRQPSRGPGGNRPGVAGHAPPHPPSAVAHWYVRPDRPERRGRQDVSTCGGRSVSVARSVLPLLRRELGHPRRITVDVIEIDGATALVYPGSK